VSTALLEKPLTANGAPAIPFESLFRVSVSMYHEMIDAGILGEDDRVELLEGVLVKKMPKNASHRLAKMLLLKALERIMPSGWFISIEDPITMSESEPEPDLAVVRGDVLDYSTRHPMVRDVAIVIEVSDTSLAVDQSTKRDLCAKESVAIYWIVNIPERRIEVYTDPSASKYLSQIVYDGIQAVPVVLDGQSVGAIPVNEILR